MAHGAWYTAGIVLLIAGLTACSPQQKVSAPQDKPLAAFQTNLLQTAFDVATAMPVVPHIKDRSRAQEAVVTACFELSQPQRALSYIKKIGNWRKGAGYADYAFYCAKHNLTNDVPHYLKLADDISAIADQDWRRDRIKARISQAHLLLGQTDKSKEFSCNLEPSESGKAELTAAQICKDDEFDAQMDALNQLTASGDFDLVQNALKASVQLYNRFYDDETRRAAVEEKIKASWRKTPHFIRIGLLADMAGFSLDYSDQTNALRLVNEAREILDGETWPAEYQMPLAARLAALRFRCGDTDPALAEMQETLVLFNENKAEIINIDKADALVPVAEAFKTMGDSGKALDVYKQAAEASVENPNSRPRAEDLSAICLSMALNKAEPDEALWNRIREIQSNLGDPW